MPATTKAARQAKVATTKAVETKPVKAKVVKATAVPVVVVETPKETIKIENTANSPRMTAIHAMWDLLQSSPMTAQQLAEQVAKSLVAKNKMESDAAAKLAASAINHQLPYEMGQKGRKTVRVREIKGGKLEWVGGAIRRRHSA